MLKLKLFTLMLCLTLKSTLALSQQAAQNLFSQFSTALYQIQMIDLESDNKSSIGSGFQISADGKLITNYHVVSEYINAPSQYRIRYMNSIGEFGELTLLDFDVVNDLALLQLPEQTRSGLHFTLSDSLPEQGTTIYSLGNPHDLGMIVVPGTFNGQKKKSYHRRIHFTGSINPGMSGGPAVTEQGQVVGVNVATAGNQIGFLVPLPNIVALAASTRAISPEQFNQHIEQQLVTNQANMMEKMLTFPWKTTFLAGASIPDSIAPFISCWGSSNADDKQSKILSVENRCRLGESIYLNDRLNTGEVEVEFEWLSTEELGAGRFYNYLSSHTANARAGNGGSEDDLSNYQCEHNLVTNRHKLNQKTVLCVRNYKSYPQLFDVLLIASSTDQPQSGLVSHFTLSGVTQASATAFTQQFLDSVSWR